MFGPQGREIQHAEDDVWWKECKSLLTLLSFWANPRTTSLWILRSMSHHCHDSDHQAGQGLIFTSGADHSYRKCMFSRQVRETSLAGRPPIGLVTIIPAHSTVDPEEMEIFFLHVCISLLVFLIIPFFFAECFKRKEITVVH